MTVLSFRPECVDGRGIHRVPLALAALAVLIAALSLIPVSTASADEVVNFLGQTAPGESAGQFRKPAQVAVNETGAGGVPAGTFYVADSGNARVQQFSPAGTFVSTWGFGVKDGDSEFEICSIETKCRAGKTGTAAGQFGEVAAGGISALAVDQNSGNVYVADQANSRINIFTAKGAFIGAFGWEVVEFFSEALQFCTVATGCLRGESLGPGYGGKIGNVTGGLAVSPNGDIYVANGLQGRIEVFRLNLVGGTIIGVEFVRAFGKDVVAGGGDGYEICTESLQCQTGTATAEAGGFSQGSPTDVEVDGDENVYALDAGNDRIQKFDSSSNLVDANFGSTAIAATFGSGALWNLGIDRGAVPNRLLVSGSRESAADKVAVLELNAAGAATDVHGEDLSITSSRGLAAAPTFLGGNIYLSTNDPVEGGGQKVFILNEPPTMDPVTTFTGTTATFSGSVVSNEIFARYHFEYSTDGVEWTSVPVADAEAGPAPGTISVSVNVTGLTGSQQYFVRLVQFRELGGRATSDEVAFNTASAAPRVTATAASFVRSTTANLTAELDAQNETTSYHFEYGPQACGLGQCTALPEHDISSGGAIPVLEALTGLQPATVYHFRLVASNATGTTVGPDRTFKTTESGSVLPDGRRYELVSPPNGLFIGDLAQEHNLFDRPLISLNGDSAMFFSTGSIPGTEGNGAEEAYKSIRTSNGWEVETVSPNGSQSAAPGAGGTSSDHAATFWRTQAGTLARPGFSETNLIRMPDGSFDVIGVGSSGEDPRAKGHWISAGSEHVIFSTAPGSAVPLEPNSPPAGTGAVYDRTGGETHVVSLLPGDAPQAGGESAQYQGASEDGTAVVFQINSTLYVRLDNAGTQEVASGFPTYAGVSGGGGRVFYLSGGDLFAYDTSSSTSLPIGSGGETTPVNISRDGSHAYFSSPQELAPGATPGARNLYVWDGSSVAFVAVLSQSDFEKFDTFGFLSLNNWTFAVGPFKNGRFGRANSPTRTNPSGTVLVFQSHGVAGFPYDSDGFSEVYRYDARDGSLACVSCSPLEKPAQGDAGLQDVADLTAEFATPVKAVTRIYNVTDDGSAVFFQAKDALVPEDTDGLQDVYEWREGRVSLVSSGASAEQDYLYAMTPNGSDVLFLTNDSLVPRDTDGGAASIYDARVGGGFSEGGSGAVCGGESCQGVPGLAPIFPAAGSTGLHGPGNVKAKKHRKKCRAGKRKGAKHKRCKKGAKHKQKPKQRNEKRATGSTSGTARNGRGK
jgi:hypothetical protein